MKKGEGKSAKITVKKKHADSGKKSGKKLQANMFF